MSFHEKTRWIGLVANILAWGWYFSRVSDLLLAGVPDEASRYAGLGLTIVVIIWTVVIHIVLTAAVAIHRPDEANAAPDERERAIGLRAWVPVSLPPPPASSCASPASSARSLVLSLLCVLGAWLQKVLVVAVDDEEEALVIARGHDTRARVTGPMFDPRSLAIVL